MKFLHTSDLHLGIKLMDVDLIEDQEYILNEIVNIAKKEKVDAVLLSGDVYDVSVPRVEAIGLLNKFLTKLNEEKINVFIISGNHDQAERLSFANQILKKSGVYISERYKKDNEPVILEDKYGDIYIYLLPYIKPINIRTEFGIDDNMTYDEAVKKAIKNYSINKNKRNVLLAHQFITGSKISESETLQVGNTDQVSSSNFDCFDYIALGHLHTPQTIKKNENMRYSGSPLKLSFSEVDKDKVCVLVELKEKGNVDVKEFKLSPLHDMAILNGTYSELVDSKELKNKYRDAYLRIELKDKKDIPFVKDKLRAVYSNVLEVEYERKTKQQKELEKNINEIKSLTDLDLVNMFFKEQLNKELNKKQSKIIENALEELEVS